jgi:uncharacterized membrane protein (DUF2068 family)
MFSVIRVLGHDLWESARDLMPVVLVVAFFQVVVLRQALPDVGRIIGGAVAVVVGLALFVRGLRLGLFPIGELMARGFARRGRLPALVVFAFALGFTTTVAEPALIAIAGEAADVAAADGAIDATVRAREAYALGLRATVAVSVGVALVVGVLRIIKGWPIRWLIIGGYLGVVALTAFAPPDIVGIAYDSGGVTTSTVTVPLVTALGVGLSSSIRGRSPLVDGFGLIALASLTPIMFVLGYGMLA